MFGFYSVHPTCSSPTDTKTCSPSSRTSTRTTQISVSLCCVLRKRRGDTKVNIFSYGEAIPMGTWTKRDTKFGKCPRKKGN